MHVYRKMHGSPFKKVFNDEHLFSVPIKMHVPASLYCIYKEHYCVNSPFLVPWNFQLILIFLYILLLSALERVQQRGRCLGWRWSRRSCRRQPFWTGWPAGPLISPPDEGRGESAIFLAFISHLTLTMLIGKLNDEFCCFGYCASGFLFCFFSSLEQCSGFGYGFLTFFGESELNSESWLESESRSFHPYFFNL